MHALIFFTFKEKQICGARILLLDKKYLNISCVRLIYCFIETSKNSFSSYGECMHQILLNFLESII